LGKITVGAGDHTLLRVRAGRESHDSGKALREKGMECHSTRKSHYKIDRSFGRDAGREEVLCWKGVQKQGPDD